MGVRERPILFSGEMVRAVLDGHKSVTRRVVTWKTRFPDFIGGRGEEQDPSKWGWFFDGPSHHGYMVLGRGLNECQDHGSISIPCPYGEPGDRLWVRESFQYADSGQQDVFYAADDERSSVGWRPSIYMPRWASRLTLEVTKVRVERIQEISEEDAVAEGVFPQENDPVPPMVPKAREQFQRLWDSINGDRSGCSWLDNPWVWAVSFGTVA